MKLINYEEALERFGGEIDIYLELAETFLETGPKDFSEINKAANEGNHERALYHSHKLKGAALTVGAESIAETSGNVEAAIRAGSTDYANKFSAELASRYEETMKEMKKLVATLKTRI